MRCRESLLILGQDYAVLDLARREDGAFFSQELRKYAVFDKVMASKQSKTQNLVSSLDAEKILCRQWLQLESLRYRSR